MLLLYAEIKQNNKPDVKNLTTEELAQLQSAKIIMTMWIRWKKKEKLSIELEEDNEGIDGSDEDEYLSKIEVIIQQSRD